MGSASKGLSEYIVNQCQKNPRIAFFVVPFGPLIAYWGISDAKRYQSLSALPTHTMTVVEVGSRPNHRGFSAPHVIGETPDGEVAIPVSAKRARQVQIGEEVGFVETSNEPGRYVLRSTVDEQAADVFFTVAGLPFNAVATLGAAIAIVAAAWGAFAKPKPADA